MSKFKIDVVDYLDSDAAVAEIYYDNVQYAEISLREEELMVQFYPHPSGEYWTFPCEEVIDILAQAKCKLIRSHSTSCDQHLFIYEENETGG